MNTIRACSGFDLESGKYDPSLELEFTIARLFKARIEDVFRP